MNRAQIVDLLTYAAACDQRTIGDSDVLVWHDMLGAIDFDAALSAMRQHYRRNPDVRLKPGHLWQLCRTQTDAEAAAHDLAQPCEHGVICATCKLVHHPHEPCDVLTHRAELEARIVSLFRRPSELESAPSPQTEAS